MSTPPERGGGREEADRARPRPRGLSSVLDAPDGRPRPWRAGRGRSGVLGRSWALGGGGAARRGDGAGGAGRSGSAAGAGVVGGLGGAGPVPAGRSRPPRTRPWATRRVAVGSAGRRGRRETGAEQGRSVGGRKLVDIFRSVLDASDSGRPFPRSGLARASLDPRARARANGGCVAEQVSEVQLRRLPTSRSSRGSSRSASGPGCTSEAPARAVCTTSSTRSSTTPSTRRSAASARRSWSGCCPTAASRSSTTAAGSPCSPSPAGKRSQARGRGRADHAARRREVRRQVLRGVRRPAWRGRFRRERALDASSSSRSRGDGFLWRQEFERGRPVTQADEGQGHRPRPGPHHVLARPEVFTDTVEFKRETARRAAAGAVVPRRGRRDRPRGRARGARRARQCTRRSGGLSDFVQHPRRRARTPLHQQHHQLRGQARGQRGRRGHAMERGLRRIAPHFC